MNSVDTQLIEPHLRRNDWWPWLPVGLALMAMYVPVYYQMAIRLWSRGQEIHGPIVLAVCFYLLWRQRHLLREPPSNQTQLILGWAFLIFGLLLYAIGDSQAIFLFSVGSQVPVLLGTVLITRGNPAFRRAWFPMLFLLFMVPLPSFLVSTLTGPLKQHVAALSEQTLYLLHYPIARNGVILTIGAYQLFVAKACSGLHSIFSLFAVGFLYLYVAHHGSVLRNTILAASILPIAFLCNVVRVITIALITFYLGNAAGQGFLHGLAGIMLFVLAALSLLLIDYLLGQFVPDPDVHVVTQ